MLPIISQKVYNITAGVSILPTISIAAIYDPCFSMQVSDLQNSFSFSTKGWSKWSRYIYDKFIFCGDLIE